MVRAMASSTGSTRWLTSLYSSVSTPPRPTVSVMPNTGSRVAPTINSATPDSIFCNSAPSISAVGA